MNPATVKALDFVADCYTPLLALIALVAPLVLGRTERRRAARYYVATAAGFGFVYLVKGLDRFFHLWPAMGLHYSTHSAFAASAVVSIALFRPRWAPAFLVSLVLYWGLILLLGYHTVTDVLTASLLSASFTAGAHWALGTWDGKRSD